MDQVMEWLSSGDGRLMAAGVLFLLIWALKSLPWVGKWLNRDQGWLTAKKKKAVANVLLGAAPIIPLLTDTTMPLRDVVVASITIILSAAGIQSKLRAFRPKPSTTTGGKGKENT